MGRLFLIAACAVCAYAAPEKTTFEVRGEIMPPAAAAVSLHAVDSPYATSTLAGPDGAFRFKDVEPGAYTVSVFIPRRGETRKTISVGPGTADGKRRVLVRIDTQGGATHQEAGATVSARDLRIPDSARREYEEAGKKIARRDFDPPFPTCSAPSRSSHAMPPPGITSEPSRIRRAATPTPSRTSAKASTRIPKLTSRS